jgi:hypothetical protein
MAEIEYLTVEHLSTKDIIRIFSKIKVDPVTGCWNWTANLRHGYGRIQYRGQPIAVHRLLYAWLVGPLPKRQKGRKTPNLDHVVCDNKRCGNPAHVQLVPPRINVLRTKKGVSAINARKTHCLRGHLLPAEPNSPGRRSCSVCSNERSRKFARTEQRKEYERRYRQEHREQANESSRESMRRRRERDPEKERLYQLNYRRNHRIEHRERYREYNREAMRRHRAKKKALRESQSG